MIRSLPSRRLFLAGLALTGILSAGDGVNTAKITATPSGISTTRPTSSNDGCMTRSVPAKMKKKMDVARSTIAFRGREPDIEPLLRNLGLQ